MNTNANAIMSISNQEHEGHQQLTITQWTLSKTSWIPRATYLDDDPTSHMGKVAPLAYTLNINATSTLNLNPISTLNPKP
jgi:hypothetical protein